MSTPFAPLSSAALLGEVNARMAQALDNFFQRRHDAVQEALLRAIARQDTPALLATGQTCLDWLNAYPDKLSAAFAHQFRQQLLHPDQAQFQATPLPAELQLLDDTVLGRQLAMEKTATTLTELLHTEMMLLFGRLAMLRRNVRNDHPQRDAYSPIAMMRALSGALDALQFPAQSGTFLIQNVTAPMAETLRHTYTAIYKYLHEQGVEEPDRTPATPAPRSGKPDVGQDILAHIQSVAAQTQTQPLTPAQSAPSAYAPTGYVQSGAGTPFPELLPSFIDSLAYWQATLPALSEMQSGTPTLVLRQMQQQAHQTDAGGFDLAMLDAVAGLFEFILDDPDVLPRYKFAIAQLQIPTLRVALLAPDFFSDDQHPARQLIDLLGQFSRRFPESDPAHAAALSQIETACASILHDPEHPAEVFAQALTGLHAWLADEKTRSEARLAAEINQLEHIERQELGTLLALENLQDLTARYPVPETVLQQLETAWMPYMASLYLAEAGEGENWRAACQTLLQLFLSLQPPEDGTVRESRLQSIPRINTALRRGLMAQGADPAQLKIFFDAITRTQECWIRPQQSQPVSRVSNFKPRNLLPGEIETLARQLLPLAENDPLLKQVQTLREGDWVDFTPPFSGLATARVAWVGVQGYFLFCDSAGEQRFSIESERLIAELRAGRARIPEQSLTQKAMLCLKMQFEAGSV